MEQDELNDTDAEFEAGFAADTPAPAPAATEPATTAVAPAEPVAPSPAANPAEPVVEDDPFAALPAPVRELLAKIPALEQRATAAEQIARTAQGRVASLQSRFERQHVEPTPAPPAPPKFPKLEAIRNELPEVAEALDEVVNATAPKPPTTPPAVPPRQEPAQIESDPQSDALDELRPSWAQDMVSADFQLWLSTRPAEFQRTVNATDKARDILGALGQYDQYKQTLSTRQNLDAQRNTRIAGALTPQGDGRRSGGRTAPVDDEDAAFEAGFRS